MAIVAITNVQELIHSLESASMDRSIERGVLVTRPLLPLLKMET